MFMKKCLAMMLTVALLMPLSSVYAKSSLTMNKWQTVKGDPKKKITYQVKVPKTSYVSFSWKDEDRKDGYIKLTRKKISYKIHDQQFKVIYLKRGTYKLSYHGEDHKQSRKIKMVMHRKSKMPALKLNTYKSFNVKKHEVITTQLTDAPEAAAVKLPYGIIVHPQQRDFYLMDAKNYVSSGELLHFRSDGTFDYKVRTGDIPAHAVFLINNNK
jgi:hypothetical protein